MEIQQNTRFRISRDSIYIYIYSVSNPDPPCGEGGGRRGDIRWALLLHRALGRVFQHGPWGVLGGSLGALGGSLGGLGGSLGRWMGRNVEVSEDDAKL